MQILAIAAPALFAAAMIRGAFGLPASDRGRVLGAFGLGFPAWLAIGWLLGANGVLQSSGTGFPKFALPVGVTVLVGLVLLRIPAWRKVVDAVPLELLLTVESLRIFGFVFLLMTRAGELPESFGIPAAWGDMLTGWLSIAAIVIWVARYKYRREAVLVATLVGMADAANALRHVLLSYADEPVFGAYPFAVLFPTAIPVLVLTHLYVLFKLLFGSSGVPGQRAGFEAPARNRDKVRVGQQVPPFQLRSLTGEIVTHQQLQGTWSWLSFHRYAACPVCNLVWREYQRRNEDLQYAGLQVVVISHSPRGRLLEFMHPGDFPFLVLADPSMDVYEQFGAGTRLLSLLHPRTLWSGVRSLGKGSINPLAADGPGHVMPADFLVDPHGTVRYVHHGAFVGDWLPVDRMLEILNGLQPGSA